MTNSCQHKNMQFRKVSGSRQAVLFCLDCKYQETMNLSTAFERIVAMNEKEEGR